MHFRYYGYNEEKLPKEVAWQSTNPWKLLQHSHGTRQPNGTAVVSCFRVSCLSDQPHTEAAQVLYPVQEKH